MQSRNIIQAFFLASVSAVLLISASANAAIVYSNDFETNSDGFNVSDRNTFSSSTFLGRQGGSYTAVLTLNGLTAGAEYDLAFDLFIGGTWDGSLSFGPDYFILKIQMKLFFNIYHRYIIQYCSKILLKDLMSEMFLFLKKFQHFCLII